LSADFSAHPVESGAIVIGALSSDYFFLAIVELGWALPAWRRIRHSPPSAQDHALRQTVQRMRHQLDKFSSYTWYEHVDPDDTSSRHGHMDLSDIPLPDNVHVFTCGRSASCATFAPS
jgi:hypothetical protein